MKNYSNASRVRFEVIRIATFDEITADFTTFGSPFGDPALLIDIFNDTDQPVVISDDGISSKVYLPSHSGRVYDFGANAQANSYQLAQAKETQIYISYYANAPTLGGVFLTVIYASND